MGRGARPMVRGKFLYVGETKFFVRGVTYGPFQPNAEGSEYGTPERAERDFSLIAVNGMNAVRVYTIPPGWLLDIAKRHGLYLMIGLPWEQHITFLDDAKRADAIVERVRESVKSLAGHSAILCWVIGNEIPSPIVRWHGARKVERFLERLYSAAKEMDPGSLVTYVNYPPTEYLHLPFLDFVCFNVYLETQDRLDAYLSRLQNVAGDQPLVMAEVGLDSMRNGEEKQAAVLQWQVSTVFTAGCCGVFVFAWTDEWFRGGHEILDWNFGIVTREREPKVALEAVSAAFAKGPMQRQTYWPKISVIVCTHNGARTIGECLEGMARLEYPDFEVIVVDDGSTDDTANILRQHTTVRLVTTEHVGLSAARNAGMRAATGEIVAYTDDDASPDMHWLTYLAVAFQRSNDVGVGGPNIPPMDGEFVAQAVAHSPGGPVHVLLSDREAEHIPGCNMAFHKHALEAVGGFDEQFKIAGDDVDVCWKLQAMGGKLGFSPAAMVWHHRRNSVGAYWRQQLNYGRAEARLERKWPGKYSTMGHAMWEGRLYGGGIARALGWWSRRRIYHGTWGSALFQSVYHTTPDGMWALPLLPEWYLLIICLTGLSLLGFLWHPLFAAGPIAGVALVASVVQAGSSAKRHLHGSKHSGTKMWALVGGLHLLQPLARLVGRVGSGLTPWRQRGVSGFALPRSSSAGIWYEQWDSPEARIEALETMLRKAGAVVVRGDTYDNWDLELRGGVLGAARIRTTIEEHGSGRQLMRVGAWPKFAGRWMVIAAMLLLLSGSAMLQRHWVAGIVLATPAVALALWATRECGAALATVWRIVRPMAIKKGT